MWEWRPHRPEAVAVQTVSVMVAFDPEVAIGNADVAVLVAQGSARRAGRNKNECVMMF